MLNLSLILVYIFFRYSSVLIQTLVHFKSFFDTCLHILSILVRIDSNTRLCNLFLDTHLYLIWILICINSTLVRVKPFFDTHPYLLSILVCIDSNTRPCNFSLILIFIFFRYSSVLNQTLVRVKPFFNTR